MTQTSEPTMGWTRPRALAKLLTMLATTVALAGCGGPPDVSGLWQGHVSFPDTGGTVTLELQQDAGGDLAGTMHFLGDGVPPEEMRSVPLQRGSVNDEGSLQVVAQAGNVLEGVATLNVTGRVEGDRMDARFGFGGPTSPYRAERITEEEWRSRLETRRQAYEAEQEAARQAAHEQSVAAARYEEAAKKAGDLAQDVEARLAVLRGGYGEGPEEQLTDALGTEGADACLTGGVGCEVSRLEERLANDREDVAEAATDDYAPDPCSTVDFEYYEGYSLAGVGGSEYIDTRDDLREAADGLAEDANEALESAREAEAAAADYEEAGGNPSSLTYTESEVEDMAVDAEEAERATEAALASAEERYSGYERRVAGVKAAAEELRASAGCGA